MPKGFDTSRPLTPQLFYQYLQCPHWIWFDSFGDQTKKQKVSELQRKLLERGVLHEEEYIQDKDVQEVTEKDFAKAVAETTTLMEQGASRIYHGALESGRWRGRPDLLERIPGKSTFGAYQYKPVDIKSSHSIHPPQAMQLILYALLLEDVQGTRPDEAAIINVDHEVIPYQIEAGTVRFSELVKKIYSILDGKKPEPYLTRQCSETPWFSECKRLAEETNDIALIYNIKKPGMQALRHEGICTVTDAAWMNPDEYVGKAPGLTKRELERIQRQATALMKKEMIIKRIATMPDAPVRIYFDIEGDPFHAVEYLFGFLVEQGNAESYISFVAESPEKEEDMWKQFLAWLPTLPEDYAVYHYATYERSRLTMLAAKYGDVPELAVFLERLVDLAVVIRDSVVLPLYFYGLKDIAKYLGFTWSHTQAGGAQSIAWYEEWLETQDKSILETIIAYNRDDVVATKFLMEWAKGLAVPSQ